MNEVNHIKSVIVASSSVVGLFCTQLFGEWNNALFALLILMSIDFVTGLTVAGIFQKSSKTFSGGLSSRVCAMGVAKKVGTLLLVVVANQADILLSVDYLRTAVIFALCASEMLSILENAGSMGILPESVQKIFDKIIDALNNETQEHIKKKLSEKEKDKYDDED